MGRVWRGVARFFGWRVAPAWARVALVLMVVILALVVLALGLCGVIPLRARTDATMSAVAGRVAIYYRKNGALPPGLGGLPVKDGWPERATDAWGRELIYSVEGADRFTLSSLGRDGVEGGVGDDRDLRRTFRVVRGEAVEEMDR